jgi:diguanylate cyclase (GGDEF)-like protein
LRKSKPPQKKKKPDPRRSREYVDDLTGLLNRRFLLLNAPRKLQQEEDKKNPISVVIVDIDHFKNVNDTFGHTRGDMVLKEFGALLKNLLRDDDIVSRYGGDEFVCILHKANYEQAIRISQRLIEQCHSHEFARVRLTASIGIASSPEHARKWHKLFEIADRNLYTAKRSGRDRIGFFEQEGRTLHIPTKDLIGRTHEIEIITEFMKPIHSNRGGAVCIRGEVGVGKTRLVQEMMQKLRYHDFAFLRSNMSATTRSIPYYPFREIIRSLIKDAGLKLLSMLPAAYRVEIEKIIPELAEDSFEESATKLMVDKYRLFEGVRKFLELNVENMQLFVVLDNIHWADEGTMELMHYLLRTLKAKPAFFFFVYRVEEARGGYFKEVLHLMAREKLYEQVTLNPLDRSAVEKMLTQVLDAKPPIPLADFIFAETGGNPFFIEELLNSLEENNAIRWAKNDWQFDESKKVVIPYSIEGVVARKMQMIERKGRGLLEHAAVIGREFDFGFLRNICGINEGELFDLLDEIMGVRLLKHLGGERYYFSEDIIREIVYRKLRGAKMKRYHEAVGEEILSRNKTNVENVIEELAHHFYHADKREKAIEYSMKAADKAKEAYANRDAIRFYGWALDCMKGNKRKKSEIQEIQCLEQRAVVMNLIGENKQAAKELKAAISKARNIGDSEREADCLLKLSKIYEDTSRYSDAQKVGEKALAIYSKMNDAAGMAKGIQNMGNVFYLLGKPKDAMECYEKALGIRRKIGDKKGESSVLNNLGIIYSNHGDLNGALKYYKSSLEITRSESDLHSEASILNNIGIVYNKLGDYSIALDYCLRAQKINEQIGDRQREALNFGNIGVIANKIGDHRRALEFYNRAMKIYEETGERQGESVILNNFGIIHSSLGNLNKALGFYEQSLRIREEIGDLMGMVIGYSNIADAYYDMGEYAKATEAFKKALNINEEVEFPFLEIECNEGLAKVNIDKGKYAQAERYIKKAITIAEDISSKPQLCNALLWLGFLYLEREKTGKAKQLSSRINKLVDELGNPETKAFALCFGGRLLTQEGKWDEAEVVFSESLILSKKLNHILDIAQVEYYRGILFSRSANKGRANRCFSEALEIFKTRGAHAWRNRAEQRILELESTSKKKFPMRRKNKRETKKGKG